MTLENNIPNSQYKRILDTIQFGIVLANTAGEFIFHNAMAKNYFFKEMNTSVETRWEGDNGVYSLDREIKIMSNETPMAKALGGQAVSKEKYFMRTKTMPEGFYIKVSSFPIFEEDGSISGGLVVFEDITKEQSFFDNIINKISDLEQYLKNHLKL